MASEAKVMDAESARNAAGLPERAAPQPSN
jgi:hypothetical protein